MNLTGAFGGVVFILLFNQLNFTEQQSIATSFAIQCFGMTAGAFTWWFHYHSKKTQLHLLHTKRTFITHKKIRI